MAKENKRFYYLQITDEFLDDKVTKAIIKKQGGDGFLLYIRILFKSVQYGEDGRIDYLGAEETIEEEIADDVGAGKELVIDLLALLERTKDITVKRDQDNKILSIDLPTARTLTGSIGASGLRMRRLRERNKTEASQCDDIKNNKENNKENEEEKESDSRLDDFFDSEEEEEEDLPYEEEEGLPDARLNAELRRRNLPTLRDVRRYCYEKDLTVNPDWYFKRMCLSDWKDQNGKPIYSWKNHIEKYSAGIKEKKYDFVPESFRWCDVKYYIGAPGYIPSSVEDFKGFLNSGSEEALKILDTLDMHYEFNFKDLDPFDKLERAKGFYWCTCLAEQWELREDTFERGNTDSSVLLGAYMAEEDLTQYMITHNYNHSEILEYALGANKAV